VPRPEQVLVGATIAALAVLAVALAVVGAFFSPSEPRVLHVPIPIGVLVAIVGNLVVGVGGAWGTRSRIAPAVTGFVWLVVAFVLANKRPEGDLIVPGTGWLGVSYLFLGAVAAAVAIGIGPTGLRRRRADSSLGADSRR
jgi:peptidoglycan/LPS O-acetylase OafA/YrhL